MTKKQVAEILHGSPCLIDTFQQTQCLPYIKLGHFIRFRLADIQRWIETRIVTRVPVNTEIETD